MALAYANTTVVQDRGAWHDVVGLSLPILNYSKFLTRRWAGFLTLYIMPDRLPWYPTFRVSRDVTSP